MRVPLISALNFRNKRVLDQISIDAAGELQIHESEGPCITEDLPGRLTVDRTLTPPRITYVVKYRDFGKLCATFTTFTAQAPKGIAAGMTLQDLSGRIYVLGP